MEKEACAICGKLINHTSSKEHLFPQAIYKWHSLKLKPQEVTTLKKLIFLPSNGNIFWTHKECNYNKQDKLISIDDLHIPTIQKEQLKKLEKQLAPALKHYKRIKKTNFLRQQGRCFKCKKTFESYNSGILRRKDPQQTRQLSNSCLVCAKCNNRYAGF